MLCYPLPKLHLHLRDAPPRGVWTTRLGAALLMLRPTQEVARGVVTALIPQPLLPPVVRQEKGSPRRAGWERRAGHAKWERRQRRAGSECRVLPFSCRTTGGRRGWGMRAVTTPRATSCVGRNRRRAAPHSFRTRKRPLRRARGARHRGDTNHLRATLGRCGQSKRKPFCDLSHVAAGFEADGESLVTHATEVIDSTRRASGALHCRRNHRRNHRQNAVSARRGSRSSAPPRQRPAEPAATRAR